MKKTKQECRCWDDQDWTQEFYRDVYDQEERDADLENGELSGWEAAFMEGYDVAA